MNAKRFAVAEAARLALGRIHALGIAHGDVRLQNFLILHDDAAGAAAEEELLGVDPCLRDCMVASAEEKVVVSLPPAPRPEVRRPGEATGLPPLACSAAKMRRCTCPSPAPRVVIIDLEHAYQQPNPRALGEEMQQLSMLLKCAGAPPPPLIS
jgi:hypothetical protein